MTVERKYDDFGESVFVDLYKAIGTSEKEANEYAKRDVIDLLRDSIGFIMDEKEGDPRSSQIGSLVMKSRTREELEHILSDFFTEEEIQSGTTKAMSSTLSSWVEASDSEEINDDTRNRLKELFKSFVSKEE